MRSDEVDHINVKDPGRLSEGSIFRPTSFTLLPLADSQGPNLNSIRHFKDGAHIIFF